MGAATARSNTARNARPRRRNENDEQSVRRNHNIETAKAQKKRQQSEARTFGKVLAVIILIAALLFAHVAQRVSIMHLSIESESLKESIDQELSRSESLETKVALKANSPQIQTQAAEKLGMGNADTVKYVDGNLKLSNRQIQSDLKFLDKQRKSLVAYKAQSAAAASAAKKKAVKDAISVPSGQLAAALPAESQRAPNHPIEE